MATEESSGKSSRKSTRKSTDKADYKPAGTGYGLGPYIKTPKKVKEEQTDPNKKPFTPEVLDRTVIAIPLLNLFEAEAKKNQENPDLEPELYKVIIDVNLEYLQGRSKARDWVRGMIKHIISKHNVDPQKQGINEEKSKLSQQYFFATLSAGIIQELVELDKISDQRNDVAEAGTLDKLNADKNLETSTAQVHNQAIYRIWPDFPIKPLVLKTISTVKANAAHNSFGAWGEEIVWAVLDSGIDAHHPHFSKYHNLEIENPLIHRDFTVLSGTGEPLVDVFKHGTHVAGIIAGRMTEEDGEITTETRYRDETGEIKNITRNEKTISGMAPRCKLISMKVLDDNGQGEASNLIAALEAIQEINGEGRRIRIHGVNMSVGYDFEPEWFACGQSPLCVEVNRLVKSGVVVVVAAGNTGYGYAQDAFKGAVTAGLGLTINDPGNAELAITVGSTHRDSPHIYGVSYFSSKGPTGDGRIKPDVVAPGEKIISCASGGRPVMGNNGAIAASDTTKASANVAADSATPAGEKPRPIGKYIEDSGTSMAAPHVSGVVAAFLSVRREFIGQPEEVKKIFLLTATDLKRDQYFQGHGLVDLMRAIQSV
ncbi:S8 family peptidase [Nitrosomonas sp. Nm58]|uniref:S8 family peptidase n=1 Tax=Nitrosomonas sp. Nm58 TaxID=200126 RepID=UPI00089BCF35|nr:S8 family peptidase [Nitrosomonas sp. Nm58]SDY96076.1 Subtilase family protein [Nitrosomonas sp. Nm58]